MEALVVFLGSGEVPFVGQWDPPDRYTLRVLREVPLYGAWMVGLVGRMDFTVERYRDNLITTQEVSLMPYLRIPVPHPHVQLEIALGDWDEYEARGIKWMRAPEPYPWVFPTRRLAMVVKGTWSF
jgi:hypothetical protein